MNIPLEFRSLLAPLIILCVGCFLWFSLYKQTTKPLEVNLNVHAENSTRRPDGSKAHDQEYIRFRNMLLNWPPDKPKAAIYYLAKPERLHNLNKSLMSLHRYFLHAFDYPVIVFHETVSRGVLHGTFRKQHANIRLFFQEIRFKTPAHLNGSLRGFNIGCARFPIGYRHMCRFHAKIIYEQEILVGLEYGWRLDDDSLILRNIGYDVFAFMKSNQLQYGYIVTMGPDTCSRYLWEAAKLYKTTRQIKSQHFDTWKELDIFYNNFEISALSLWTSQQYQDYIDYIDLLGGVYYQRWGDAPIKTIAVTLFLRKEETHLFNVSYFHQGFKSNP